MIKQSKSNSETLARSHPYSTVCPLLYPINAFQCGENVRIIKEILRFESNYLIHRCGGFGILLFEIRHDFYLISCESCLIWGNYNRELLETLEFSLLCIICTYSMSFRILIIDLELNFYMP